MDSRLSRKAIVALNGQLMADKDDYKELINTKFPKIAADGGALLLERIGYKPDVIVGDFDSLGEKCYQRYKAMGIKIKKYQIEKDETDGELAINYCYKNGYKEVMILGALGGRLDHQLANLYLLEFALKRDIEAIILEPGIEIGLVNKRKTFINCKGALLSLLPLDTKVRGISITGCKYLLHNDELLRYKTRGVSNKVIAEKAMVEVKEGLLLYIKTENDTYLPPLVNNI